MSKIKIKKNMAVANDLGGGKRIRGTRIKKNESK